MAANESTRNTHFSGVDVGRLLIDSVEVTATATQINTAAAGGGAGYSSTAAEIDAVCDVSARLVALAATTLAVTAATHAGKIVMLNHTGAASTCTLPAATGTGNIYHFIVGAVNTSNHVIKVTGDDVMYGAILSKADDDAVLITAHPTAADSDTITLNGTTTGGAKKGDFVKLIDIAADTWAVEGRIHSSGTEATCFSATVA